MTTEEATWEEVQRTAYRAGELPADQIRELESIPGWSWEPNPELQMAIED